VWGELVIDSLKRPRLAARRILGLDLPADTLVQAATLVACGGTLLFYLAARVVPPPADAEFAAFVRRPLLATVLNLVQLGLMAALATWVGRLFGGVGSLAGATALVVWYNLVSLLLLALLLLAIVVLPPLGIVLAFAFCLWMVWVPANFVAELHSFQNAAVVFAGLLLTLLALFIVLNLAFMLLGLAPAEGV
jgi:hypothetical protein